jgi:Subtilase family
MSGNKPNGDPRALIKAPGFTQRLMEHPRIGYYIYPDGLCGLLADDPDDCPTIAIAFVIDQLLVTSKLAEHPKFSKELAKFATSTGVWVFGPESGVAHEDNVEIFELHGAAKSGKHSHADVAEAVWELRTKVPSGMDPQMVAPNHVLVPPGRTHECPYGAPRPYGSLPLPPRAYPSIEVVVIDSGFIMQSPISLAVTNVSFGEWLARVPTPSGAVGFDWEPGTEAPPGITTPLDQNGDCKLDALAGHANFVAGVVARSSEHAELTVDSLNSSVIDSDTSIPGFVTEAEVARCWWEHRDAPVVNVGYAFATLPNQALNIEDPPNVVNGPPSWSFQVVMDDVGDTEEHMIVAPAGNQDCTVRQYPAAFSLTYSNVAGVGSVDASGNPSSFSNHGPWVNCCTGGENVASTFVDSWDGPTEDGDPVAGAPEQTWPHPDKVFSGWALWSGTSFAARVTAAIAEAVATGNAASPAAAWRDLTQGGPTPGLDMGTRLDGLPPVSP